MRTLLKTNLEARSVALSSSSTNLSLFAEQGLEAIGIYLNPRQSYEHAIEANQVVILHVFQGAGEFEVIQEGQDTFKAQITRGDIFSLPTLCSYKIDNQSKSNFIASVVVMHKQ